MLRFSPIMMRNIMQGLEIGGRGKWKAGGRRSEIGVGESGGRESGGRESEGRESEGCGECGCRM